GGMPRVYEISRNFRNEGVDKSHNPEFTSLEVYQAFGNYETMMELAESLIRELARLAVVEREDEPGARTRGLAAEENEIPGEANTNADASNARDISDADLKIPFGDWIIDYGSPFVRVTYGELFQRAMGFAMTDEGKVRDAARRHYEAHHAKH